MTTLALENVPDDLVQRLLRIAERDGRSLEETALDALVRGASQPEMPSKDGALELVARMIAGRALNPARAGVPDPAALIREDRGR